MRPLSTICLLAMKMRFGVYDVRTKDYDAAIIWNPVMAAKDISILPPSREHTITITLSARAAWRLQIALETMNSGGNKPLDSFCTKLASELRSKMETI